MLRHSQGLGQRCRAVRVAHGGGLQLTRSLQVPGAVAHVPLEGGTGGEVAGPEVVGSVRVGEVIIVLDAPRQVSSVLGVGVFLGGRIEKVDSAVEVSVVDELVEVLVPRLGVGVLEVRAHRPHDMVGAVVVRLVQGSFHGVVDTFLDIDIMQAGVVLDWGIAAPGVPVKTAWRTVAGVERAGEDLSINAKGRRTTPKRLHVALVETEILVLVVKAPEEEPVKSSLS
mmetsp:Transcript_15528/g.24356  ORF Transcript_15528/g.24356 Transcript_15528/m.24356 type:complete len:226 (+) Transcript_15528:1744-2421(+)